MSGIAALSTGSIERIMGGEVVEKPVLQILRAKKISGGECERLRLLVSDGKYFNSFAMLATQLNHLYSEGKLEEYTIIQVEEYISSMVNKTDTNSKRVLIIRDLTVLNPGAQVGKKIGNPIIYIEAVASAGSQKREVPNAKPTPKMEIKPSFYNNDYDSSGASSSGVGSSGAGSSGVGSSGAGSSGAGSSNNSIAESCTMLISSLNPYLYRWRIKARVTAKSPIRSWSNAKGEGIFFSMDLIDASGEIRATAFKEQCNKFYDMIEVDRVYYFSRCQLKPAKKQFNKLNDYEMTFKDETVVELCDEQDTGIPEIKYDLVPISQIANIDPKAAVDTIGICKDVGELQVFTSRTTNKELKKRELTLVDPSNAAVNLTLWGDEAVNFDGHVQPVILVKGGIVNEYNGGKSLSISYESVLKINPNIPENYKLRGWFDYGGSENIFKLVSARTGGVSYNTEWPTLHEARTKNLGAGDKPDYFQCKAVVHIVKSQNFYYKACPQAGCNKKVIDENNGHYRCERCNAVFPDFKYSLLVNMSIGDWTSNRWVTCFNEIGEQMLKRSAQEVAQVIENNQPEGEEIFAALKFSSYIFKLRSKVEIYGDVHRNKLTVLSVSPVNYKEYNKYLIKNLKELTGVSEI